jgi:hypothetical protein
MCPSNHMQVILLSQLVDILPTGTSPLQLHSRLLMLDMITIINRLSNSRILVVLHLQLMGLLIITVNHLPLVIANRDRAMVRMAMVHINNHHNQGMVSRHHMISSKVMARPQAMALHKMAKLPTMDHKGIHLKYHLPSKVMVAANSLAQILPTIQHKVLLNRDMVCPQPLKQLLMAIKLKHSLVMEPLHLKSLVALLLHMDKHSHLMRQVVMGSQGTLLPRPHLHIPNQKQALKGHHHLVMAVLVNLGTVLHRMVLQQVVKLVMVSHHRHTAAVLMVLVILRPQHILQMVMQVGLHRQGSSLVLLSHLRADIIVFCLLRIFEWNCLLYFSYVLLTYLPSFASMTLKHSCVKISFIFISYNI